MVGLPEMRRGSLTLVTRPSTVAPTGIKVLPLTTTACVTLAWKGSPTRLLKVARVVSSRTIRAVPAGTGVLVWAASDAASNSTRGRAIHFFMGSPQLNPENILPLTLVFVDGCDNMLAGQGTIGDKSTAALAGWTVPKTGIIDTECVGRPTVTVSIRYNRWSASTYGQDLYRYGLPDGTPDRSEQ